MKKSSFYIGLTVQIFVFSIVIFITTILLSSYVFTQYSKDLYKNQVENKIKDISTMSSLQFDSSDLDQLINFEDFKKDEYEKVKNEMLDLKSKIQYIKYAVIVRKIDDENAFSIIDTSREPQDINNDGKISPETEGIILLGDSSNDIKIKNDLSMFEGFMRTSVSSIIHKDEMGSFIRVYSPIGKFHNYLLITDIYSDIKNEKDENLFDIIQNTGLISLFVVILFCAIYSFILVLPIKKLLKISEKIKNDDYKTINLSPLYGEMSKLGDYINYFSDKIKNLKEKEEETNIIISKKKKIIETTNKQLQQKNHDLNNTIITLNRINKIVEELISIKDTDKLMESVLLYIIEILNAEKCFIIKNDENKSFSVLASLNTKNIHEEQELKFTEIPCLKTVFETMNYTNIHEKGTFISEEFENALVFPLIIENDINGLLFIMNKKSDKEEKIHFTETDESTVRTLSKLVSAVWESITLFEMATVDSMSKLYVRRYFEKSLEEELKYANKENYDLHLIMMDIDNLQKYNNKYGRVNGDKIIEKVAEIIKFEVGSDILTGRYGGDKFVSLVSNNDIEFTLNLAEKIRDKVSNSKINIDEENTDNFTISIGIASFTKNSKTAEQLLRDSEIALYKSKQDGKNKVKVF